MPASWQRHLVHLAGCGQWPHGSVLCAKLEQRGAPQQLHHQVHPVLFVPPAVVDPQHAGVIDLVRRQGLVEEPLGHLLVGGEAVQQQLYRHLLARLPMAGQVDRPHASLAQHLQQFVAGEGLPDEGMRVVFGQLHGMSQS